MPPIGERMASVEVGMRVVVDDLAEIKTDVKTLLHWMTEERAARRQRQLTRKQLVGLLSALSGLSGALGAVLTRVL